MVNEQKKKTSGWKGFILWIFGIFIVETFVFQPFYIPSGSMIPTLAIGDEIIVNKMAYGISGYSNPLPFMKSYYIGGYFWNKPKIGDVVVFRNPKQIDVDFIKRVIALPGDKVQLKSGMLYINGIRQDKYNVTSENLMNMKNYGMGVNPNVYYKEDLNKVLHYVEQDGTTGDANNTKEYIVPEGHFFAMGDNRNHSFDSRFKNGISYVPLKNIIGKSEFVLISAEAPTGGIISLLSYPLRIRWNRIFNTMSL